MSREIRDYRVEERRALEEAFRSQHIPTDGDWGIYLIERQAALERGEEVWVASQEEDLTAFALFRSGRMVGFVDEDRPGQYLVYGVAHANASATPLDETYRGLMDAVDSLLVYAGDAS